MYAVVFSGPRVSAQQVRTALRAAGLPAVPAHVLPEPWRSMTAEEMNNANEIRTAFGAPPIVPAKPPAPDHTWGLPSYVNVVTAHEAGKPNSGHTPGTPHPAALPTYRFVHVVDGEEVEKDTPEGAHRTELVEVPHDCDHIGEDYEPDPDVAFVACYADHPDRAVAALSSFPMWWHRSHRPWEGVE